MSTSARTATSRAVVALAVAVLGFMAFNLFDTVFGIPEAVAGLVAWTVLTVIVFRRAPAATAERSDA